MKRFIGTSVLLFLFLLFISCNSSSSKIVEGAKVIERNDLSVSSSIAQPLFLDTGQSEYIGAVAIYDIGDGGAILQKMSGEFCLTWLDLSTGEERGLVRRGRGPDEMVDAGFSGYWRNEQGDIEMAAYSISTLDALYINLTQSLSDNKTIVLSKKKLPKGTMYALANESSLFCYTFDLNNTISWKIIDTSGDIVSIQPFGNNGQVSDPSKYFAASAISDHGNSIVMGMASFPRLFILNRRGQSLAVSLNSESDDRIIDRLIQNDSNTEDYCLWIQFFDREIYCLTADQEGIESGRNSELLMLFDCGGHLKSVTRIPEALTSFIVADEGESIIGITMNGQINKFLL